MADRGRTEHGEPLAASSRPAPEMPAPTSPHIGHDTLILAAAVDHDPDPGTLATVERMVAECPECAAIVDDLRLLASGLAGLPAEMPAPRDFRITDVQAERLRRGGFLRRLLQPFGIDGLPGLQPLAGALTTIGLAGILLTNLPAGLVPSAASAPLAADRSNSGAAGAQGNYATAGSNAPEAQAGAPSQVPAGAVDGKSNSPEPPSTDTAAGPQPASSAHAAPSDQVVAGPAGGASPGADAVARTSTAGGGIGLPAIPPLTFVSLVLLLAGVALFSLRLMARRFD